MKFKTFISLILLPFVLLFGLIIYIIQYWKDFD